MNLDPNTLNKEMIDKFSTTVLNPNYYGTLTIQTAGGSHGNPLLVIPSTTINSEYYEYFSKKTDVVKEIFSFFIDDQYLNIHTMSDNCIRYTVTEKMDPLAIYLIDLNEEVIVSPEIDWSCSGANNRWIETVTKEEFDKQVVAAERSVSDESLISHLSAQITEEIDKEILKKLMEKGNIYG